MTKSAHQARSKIGAPCDEERVRSPPPDLLRCCSPLARALLGQCSQSYIRDLTREAAGVDEAMHGLNVVVFAEEMVYPHWRRRMSIRVKLAPSVYPHAGGSKS